MAEHRLAAQPRNAAITTRALRRSGQVPGVFYDRNGANRQLQFDAHEVELLMRHEIAILKVEIGGETLQCLIREVQRHPVRRFVVHIDLMGFVAGQKIKSHIPIHPMGTAAGTKEGGVLELVLRDLEIECLPDDLPTHIELDVTHLALHDALRIADIKLPGITIHGDPNAAVVHVIPPRTHAEAAPAAATAAAAPEPEVIREKKPAADEAPKKEDKKK